MSRSIDQAGGILAGLDEKQFNDVKVSALFPTQAGIRGGRETVGPSNKYAKTNFLRGGVRAVPTGAYDWLAGTGTLVISGGGPTIAAGPIAETLSTPLVGRQVEGIGDALIVMGIPEPDARRCEEKVREGWILISVSSHNPDELRQAKEIIETNNAQIAFTTAGPGAKIPQPGLPEVEPSVTPLR